MSEIRKAILFSVLNQHSLQIIHFATVAILARLLSPDEVGVFAVATSIAYLAIEIRSFGVGEFLVREHEIDEAKVRSVLGVMAIMSWGLALVLAISAPWIADFYKVADLKEIIWIVTVPFLVAPYSSVPYALMAREMNFAGIFKVDLFGSIARNFSSIGLVLLGYGYFGLAWGTLIGVMVEFLAITYYRSSAYSWVPHFGKLREIFHTGLQISAGKFLNSTSQNASDLVLGRMASMGDVGLYSRGLGLITFLQNSLISSVSPVALPHLSKIRRSGGSVGEAYLNAITLAGAFTLPLFAVVNLSAYSMITALFGDQWKVSVHIASVLAIWAMLQSVHCFSSSALLATGNERLVLLKEALSFFFKFLLIVLSVKYGLENVAWGFVISGTFDLLFATFLIKRAYHIGSQTILVAFLPNIYVALACWCVLRGMQIFVTFEAMNSWLAVMIIGTVMVPTWLFALKLTNNKAWPFVVSMLARLGKLGASEVGLQK